MLHQQLMDNFETTANSLHDFKAYQYMGLLWKVIRPLIPHNSVSVLAINFPDMRKTHPFSSAFSL